MRENNKQEILLESGTNEIEIMEFKICGNIFGINVAKVREIMKQAEVTRMPHAHGAVAGIFKQRGQVITVIDLPLYLGFEKQENADRDLFIITNFNKLNIAFRVHEVVGIDRVSWASIQKPDKTIYGDDDGVATGIVQYEDRLITILDFEKIVAEISPETSIKMSEIEGLGKRGTFECPIVIAEDSVLLSKMIHDALHRAGFMNLVKCDNGQEAWDFLTSVRDEDPLFDKAALIVTDIEMPMMDGHRLTKLVKDDPVLKKIPVVIFSSLINEEMRVKGRELGADEQLSKPEIGHLVEVIDTLIKRAHKQKPNGEANK